MKFKYLAVALATSAFISACGGGSDGPRAVDITPPPVTSLAQITSVTPDASIKYGQTAHFTIAGTNLTSGVTLASTGCAGAATVGGATPTSLIMTCVPIASGAVAVTFAPTNGAVQQTVTQSVPLPQVAMVTSLGTIKLELYPNNTPITVANFMQYVQTGFYANKIFHRVIKDFVIQGGGFSSAMVAAATGPAIKLEVGKGLSNLRGTIAMARTSDPDSATSQFFINTVDNVSLDTSGGGYAVFGKVISGIEVVDAIRAVPTAALADGTTDVPVTPVLTLSVTQTQ